MKGERRFEPRRGYLHRMSEQTGPLRVTCALIEDGGRVLCARRSASMAHPLKWEFPGGKVEPGEDEAACLVREILEELAVRVEVLERLPDSPHTYPGGRPLVLIPFLCRIAAGVPEPLQHDELRWAAPEELPSLDWAEADVPIWREYLARKVRP